MGIVIRQSLKATIISYVGASIGALIVVLLYPRYLSPEQIGLLRTLTEAAMFIAFFAQLGMSNVAIKFFPVFKDSSKNHHGFLFLIVVIPFLGFLLFSLLFHFIKPFITSLFEGKSALFNEYLIMLIPLTLFFVYTTIFETYSSLQQRIVVPKFIKEIVIRLLTILIVVLFFLKIINLDQFVILFVSIYGIAAILNVFYSHWIQRINLRPQLNFIQPPLRGEMIRFLLFMVIVGIGSNISGKIDVFMLGNKVGLDGTGIFSIAFFIASFIEMPTRAVYQITTPLVVEAMAKDNYPEVHSLYKRVAMNQLIISGVLFLLIWTNADNIFSIMPNGEIYQASKYVILYIGLARVFDASTGTNATILGYSKYYYLMLFFIFFLAFITVINNLLFIPKFGIVGSAMATAISIFLYNLIMVIFVWVKFKMQPFSTHTVKVIFLIAFLTLLNPLFGSFESPVFDAIIRCIVIVTIYGLIIYSLDVSPDLNAFARSIYTKYIKRGR